MGLSLTSGVCREFGSWYQYGKIEMVNELALIQHFSTLPESSECFIQHTSFTSSSLLSQLGVEYLAQGY